MNLNMSKVIIRFLKRRQNIYHAWKRKYCPDAFPVISINSSSDKLGTLT